MKVLQNEIGMRLTGMGTDANSDNKFLYNGKELEDDFGVNVYDYGARNYDFQLGRWWQVDPADLSRLIACLSTRDEFHSPYVYVGNNVVNAIDPDGERCYIWNEVDNTIRYVSGTSKDSWEATHCFVWIGDESKGDLRYTKSHTQKFASAMIELSKQTKEMLDETKNTVSTETKDKIIDTVKKSHGIDLSKLFNVEDESKKGFTSKITETLAPLVDLDDKVKYYMEWMVGQASTVNDVIENQNNNNGSNASMGDYYFNKLNNVKSAVEGD